MMAAVQSALKACVLSSAQRWPLITLNHGEILNIKSDLAFSPRCLPASWTNAFRLFAMDRTILGLFVSSGTITRAANESLLPTTVTKVAMARNCTSWLGILAASAVFARIVRLKKKKKNCPVFAPKIKTWHAYIWKALF